MLRSKISIVLAPKVMKDIDSIAKANEIKSTEILTMFIEELYLRKREDVVKIMLEMSLEVPDNFGKIVESEEVLLPYKIKEIIIPDVCPECGETEDILGNKVLYHSDGYIHCKSCMAKIELK